MFNTVDLTDFTYQKTVILHNKIKLLDQHLYNTKRELLQKVLRHYGTKKCACCGQKFRKDATKFQCIVCNVAQYCSKKCKSNDSFQHKSFCETLQLQEELYIKGSKCLTFDFWTICTFSVHCKKGLINNSTSEVISSTWVSFEVVCQHKFQ